MMDAKPLSLQVNAEDLHFDATKVLNSCLEKTIMRALLGFKSRVKELVCTFTPAERFTV